MEIINLDMTPSTVTPNAHAGQYDASRTVRFMLKNGGVPFTLAGTEIITAEITRSDNTEVTVNVANTSSNYVDVVFDDTVCTVKGLYACELRLKDSDGFDIGSKNFALLVQRDPYDGAGVVVETIGPADICTFETTLAEPLQSVIVNVLATGGNGTPDNPNPINGYTEAKITRCGVNLWDEEWELGNINASGEPIADGYNRIRSKNFIPCTPNTTFYIKEPSNTSIFKPFFYDCNNVFISEGTWVGNNTITTPLNCCYMKFVMATAYGTTYNNDISINYPSTDTDYHAYNGQTFTVAFGQTVYGGVLDVTRGNLSVTHQIVDLGDLAYIYLSNNVFFASLVGCVNDTGVGNMPSIVCDSYIKTIAKYASTWQTETQDKIISLGYDSSRVYIRDSDYSDSDVFGSAMSGRKLVYPLATPFDIDLTPEVISAIVGENNVFADCGETEVKYLKAGA